MSISVDKYFGWTIDLKADLTCNDFKKFGGNSRLLVAEMKTNLYGD